MFVIVILNYSPEKGNIVYVCWLSEKKMGKLLRFIFIIALKKNMFSFYIFGHCNIIYRCYFILTKSTHEDNLKHFIGKNFAQDLEALKD